MSSLPYARRQAALCQHLLSERRGLVLLPAAREVPRNGDTPYPYRQDSRFLYLCGFPEPEAVFALVLGDTPRSILFCRDKDPARELWDGFRYGPEGAVAEFGLSEAYPLSALDTVLCDLIADQPALYYPVGQDAEFDARIHRALEAVRPRTRSGTCLPSAFVDVRPFIDELRLKKDDSEIETMRRAAAISVAAHCRAMAQTRPGLMEYEIEAEIAAEFRRRGAQSAAYPSIVAGGQNACVLHYIKNDQALCDGDLLLIDAGCELDGYASDVTRTFPVNGRFSPPQRVLYELVLAAQDAALAAIAPGASWNAPHEAAVAVLTQGLIDLKWIEGPLEAAIGAGAYRPFYMHRTGHWLGLDVHDVGDYYAAPGAGTPEPGQERPWRRLEEGMTLTVEPGLYVRPDEQVPKEYWHIGIRIEDDVVVTAAGCSVLSAGLPRTVPEIETLMAQGAGRAR